MSAGESKSKIRIVKILDILKAESDANHPISTVELMEKLTNEGISTNRKTLYDDIDVINNYYAEIHTTKSTQNKYYLSDREFDYTELLIIASAIMAAGFIDEIQTNDLVNRIYNLTSKWQRDVLKQSISLKNPYKHSNKEIFINIETIIEAIRKKKKLIFDYYHYTLDKEKESYEIRVSPVDLIYSNDLYYFIAYVVEKNKYYTFRIDKMVNVDILSEEIDKNTYNSKKYINEQFSSKTFQMFDGPEEDVRLRIHKSIVDPIIDKFGEGLIIKRIDDDWGEIWVKVKVSRTFFSWVSSFNDKIKIIEPVDVKVKYINQLKNIINLYEV